MATFTNRRAGREVAVFVSQQTAKGTPDYTLTASNAIRCERVAFDFVPVAKDPTPAFMTEDIGPPSAARVRTTAEGEGEFTFQATWTALNNVFWSGCGNIFAGGWTMPTTVNTWMTIAWVEDRYTTGSSTKYLLPYSDCYIDKITLDVEHNGKVLCTCHFFYEVRHDPVSLDSLGSWSLPTQPMEPSDTFVYDGRGATFYRDPSGTPVAINYNSLQVILDHKAKARPFMSNSNRWTVWKGGKLDATILMRIESDDVSWVDVSNVIDGTFNAFQLKLDNARTGVNDFKIWFYEVDWLVGPYTDSSLILEPFEMFGRAHVDTSGNYIAFSA